MSLNWNISKTEGYKLLEKYKEAGDEKAKNTEWALAESLIWMTMSVGFGGITEKNKEEFFARTIIAERLHGASRRTTEEYWLPVDEQMNPVTS